MTNGKAAARAPIYRSIAQELRQAIAQGAYAPGDRLPTELRLAERFGVNRHTVRHAIGLLAEEGLVLSRRGSGTTVLDRPLDYRIGERVRFHQNLLAEGRTPAKKVLSVEVRRASAQDARVLKIPEGAAVCVYDAVSYANERPIAVAHSRFPEHRLEGIAAALRGTSSVTEALARVGVSDYVRRSTRLSAELASATLALQLSVRQGDPLLHASSVNVDAKGSVVEHGRTWFAGHHVTLLLGE